MSKTFLTDLNLSQNELQNAVIQKLSTAPSNPAEGQVYYNTTELKTYQWNGREWIPFYQGKYATTIEAVAGTAENLLMNPASTKAAIDAAVEQVENAGIVTLESASGSDSDSHIKRYTMKQGGTTVGTIDIPKDLVVQSGELVIGSLSGDTFTAGQTGTTYLKLVIANQSTPIYINVAELVDIYTAGTGVSISNNQISIKTATSSVLGGVKVGSNITVSNGTISITSTNIQNALGNQNANVIYAGPASGSASKPTFRYLVLKDIPDLGSLYNTSLNISNPALTTVNGVVTWDIPSSTLGNISLAAAIVQVYDNSRCEVICEIKKNSSSISIIFNSTSNISADQFTAVITSIKAS